mmetsp:Transcript_44789/g.89459  ORF Transcript_44789/g.89459 Transcript_44789/m.89459 type:complete len:232 (+) Transcript_44789:92-787(+)
MCRWLRVSSDAHLAAPSGPCSVRSRHSVVRRQIVLCDLPAQHSHPPRNTSYTKMTPPQHRLYNPGWHVSDHSLCDAQLDFIICIICKLRRATRLLPQLKSVVGATEACTCLQEKEDGRQDEHERADRLHNVDQRVEDVQADRRELVVLANRVHHQPVEHVADRVGVERLQDEEHQGAAKDKTERAAEQLEPEDQRVHENKPHREIRALSQDRRLHCRHVEQLLAERPDQLH